MDFLSKDQSKKDLISVLWSGADVLRSKMDANEYKDYILGFVFYKYLSDSFLVKVYDLVNDSEPESIRDAQIAYEEIYDSIQSIPETRQESNYWSEDRVSNTQDCQLGG